MDGWAQLSLPALTLAAFGLAVASAVFPWFNAEIVVLALPVVAPSRGALLMLVIVVTAGQMAGKCVVYCAGRAGSRRAGLRTAAAVEKWRDRIVRWRSGPIGLVFFSSAVGLPPFFAVTAMAGALKIDFVRFVLAGTAGRLLRFGAVAFVPQLIAPWL